MRNWMLQLKYPRFAMLLFGAVLFFYIILRAVFVSFTHDEALTVMMYATQPWSYINHLSWTNNHLLNSWLVYFCLDVFGPRDFWLRLPNVLAGFLFLLFSARFFRRIFSESWMAVAAFLFVACNSFLIDFFGLARGYGLSMGLMMGGLYYFYRYLETGKIMIYASLSFVFMGLALLANYTLLNFFLLQIAFFLAFEIRYLLIKKNSSLDKKKHLLVLVPLSVVIYFFSTWFIRMMMVLRKQGNFNFGGNDGFWNNTVQSLIGKCCAPMDHWGNALFPLLTWSALILFVMAGGVIVFRFIKFRIESSDWFAFFIFFLIFGCGAGIWLQHKLMDVPYSIDRAGLYFLVLFPILLFLTLFKMRIGKLLFRFPAILLLLFPLLSFFLSLNLSKTLMWSFNGNTKQAVEAIINDSRSHIGENENTQVSVSYLQYPVFNYYVYANKAYWINFVPYGETEFRNGSDYFLEDECHPSPNFTRENYKSIWNVNYQEVFRREPALNSQLLHSLGKITFEEEDGRPKAIGHSGRYSEVTSPQLMYSRAFSDTLKDTLRAGTIIQYHTYLLSKSNHTQAVIVFNVQREGVSIVWTGIYAAWFLHDENKWNSMRHLFVLENDLLPGDVVVSYLLNDGKTEIDIDDFSVNYFVRESVKK